MREGLWFVADEFDLAEPAVMNVLYPLLEGQTTLVVPNTTIVIQARPEFRFFATQNGTQYAGRKEAPSTLRSRFVEITFPLFSTKELEHVIARRSHGLSTHDAA